MMTFPMYAKVFYPKPKVQPATVATVDNKQQVSFTIQGMTCEGCEEHVNNELSKVTGVLAYKTSYASKAAWLLLINQKLI
ncbi:MAG: cation transporter [Segetibacter sp.]